MQVSKGWIAPEDYKVFCFNGEPEYIMVCAGREEGAPKFYFFNKEWELQKINASGKNPPNDFNVDKPDCLDKLLEYARKLSKPFPFVRVDFYIEKNKIYFGELTFTPSAGLDSQRWPETDKLFGNLLKL